MIARLLAVWTALLTSAATARPLLPAAAARSCELAGLACAGVFLHQLWAPLVWAAAAAVLLAIGQRR